jgi:hypothetical protein
MANDVTNGVELTHFVSDSLVLVSKRIDDREAGHLVASDFLVECIAAMELGFEMSYPLRGAIGLGAVLWDESANLLLSPALKELVEGEKSQEWSGCFVLDDAAQVLTEMMIVPSETAEAVAGEHVVLRYPVPFKGIEQKQAPDLLALNWPTLCERRSIDAGLAFLQGPKAASTKAFIEHVAARRRESGLPPEAWPATHMRWLRSRRHLRLQTLDAEGNRCDPPPGVLSLRLVGTLANGQVVDLGAQVLPELPKK